MLNRNIILQLFKVLFITGNYSGILSRLHRRFTELEIRRSFTTFQLMTILEIRFIIEQMVRLDKTLQARLVISNDKLDYRTKVLTSAQMLICRQDKYP
jgi:hypothetical protein